VTRGPGQKPIGRGSPAGGSWELASHAPDYGLIIITLALLCIGIVMVYSASVVASYAQYGDRTYFFQRQLLWSGLGVVVMFLFTRLPYTWLRRVSVMGLLASVALLIAVLLPGIGTAALGATRWIKIGGLVIGQPSELCKVTLAIYMADWLSRKGERVREFGYGFLPFIIVLTLIVGLVMKQPDMGTTLVIVGTAVTIFFVSGADLMQLIPVGLLGVAGIAALTFSSNYRHGRITAFLDPWADPSNTGYHVVQSLIALGAGGVQGLGLGDSRQKFGLLPFPYTDSIFAVIGEELGLVGCAVVLILFLLLAYRGLRTARRCPDRFGALLAIGISCQMALQAFLNIAVVTATVPFTGITLPFVSYGGSSMLVSFAAMGILLNITKFTQEHSSDGLAETSLAAAADRRRHWWARLSHARRGAGRAQPVLARS
jgi:cell division protein FtsW